MPNINSPTPDATTATKGKIQLAGGLSGTAALPVINYVNANHDHTNAANGGLIPGAALTTSAITLASVSTATSQTGITSANVIITGLTATVTNPTGGRTVRIEVLMPSMTSTNICTWKLAIYNSATVTGSPIHTHVFLQPLAGVNVSGYTFWEGSVAAGSQSFCAAIAADTGTGATTLTSTQKAFLTVKVQ